MRDEYRQLYEKIGQAQHEIPAMNPRLYSQEARKNGGSIFADYAKTMQKIRAHLAAVINRAEDKTQTSGSSITYARRLAGARDRVFKTISQWEQVGKLPQGTTAEFRKEMTDATFIKTLMNDLKIGEAAARALWTQAKRMGAIDAKVTEFSGKWVEDFEYTRRGVMSRQENRTQKPRSGQGSGQGTGKKPAGELFEIPKFAGVTEVEKDGVFTVKSRRGLQLTTHSKSEPTRKATACILEKLFPSPDALSVETSMDVVNQALLFLVRISSKDVSDLYIKNWSDVREHIQDRAEDLGFKIGVPSSIAGYSPLDFEIKVAGINMKEYKDALKRLIRSETTQVNPESFVVGGIEPNFEVDADKYDQREREFKRVGENVVRSFLEYVFKDVHTKDESARVLIVPGLPGAVLTFKVHSALSPDEIQDALAGYPAFSVEFSSGQYTLVYILDTDWEDFMGDLRDFNIPD